MGMPIVKMTDSDIGKQPLGSGTYLIVNGSREQESLRAFMLVCNSASASFVIQRKLRGKSVTVKPGARGEINVTQAHAKAVEVLKRLNEGENPNANRRAARDEEDDRLTLRSTFERYVADKARTGKLKPNTIALYRHIMNKHPYSLAGRTTPDIAQDKFVLSDLHERLTRESGWDAANNAIKVFSYVFNRALDFEDDLPASPKRRVENRRSAPRGGRSGSALPRHPVVALLALRKPSRVQEWVSALYCD